MVHDEFLIIFHVCRSHRFKSTGQEAVEICNLRFQGKRRESGSLVNIQVIEFSANFFAGSDDRETIEQAGSEGKERSQGQ